MGGQSDAGKWGIQRIFKAATAMLSGILMRLDIGRDFA
jgi:hypothetical protein